MAKMKVVTAGDHHEDTVSPASKPLLSVDEVTYLTKAFGIMDERSKGEVTRQQFTKAVHADERLSFMLSRGVISDKGKRHLDLKQVAQLWAEIDSDVADTVSLSELLAFYHVYEADNSDDATQQAAAAAENAPSVADEAPATPDISAPLSLLYGS